MLYMRRQWKTTLVFDQEKYVVRQDKITNDTMSDGRPLRSYGTQHTTEEKVRIFQNIIIAYDMNILKPLGHH